MLFRQYHLLFHATVVCLQSYVYVFVYGLSVLDAMLIPAKTGDSRLDCSLSNKNGCFTCRYI